MTGTLQFQTDEWPATWHALDDGLEWQRSRESGVALVLVDAEDAAWRVLDQRAENKREIRDLLTAYRIAGAYDDGARMAIDRLVAERVDYVTRRCMITAYQPGYATLRNLLVYDQGVHYLIACIVAFRLRSLGDQPRSWL